MTDTNPSSSQPPAPPPTPRPHPRWERPADRRVIAGVAQGAADALGVGVGWVRFAFIVLLILGGLAIPLYLAGWLLMPNQGEPEAIAVRWARGMGGGEAARWAGVALIVIAAIVLLSSTGLVRGGWIWAAALLVVGVLLYRGDLDIEPKPRKTPPASDQESLVYGATPRVETTAEQPEEVPTPDEAIARYAATPYDAGIPEPAPSAPPAPPPPPRPRSILGRLTIAGVLLTLGAMALLDNLDITRPDARHYIAGILAVLGVALVVGTWWGRTRGSIVFGLLLIPALVLTTVVNVPFEGDIGDVRYNPANVLELDSPYEHAIGELRIDLRNIDDDAQLTADLGIGLLWVIVPADADVTITSEVGIGELDLLDLRRGGVGVDRTYESAGDGPELLLDLEVGIGEVRVDRARS